MRVRPVIDAGPCLNFLAANAERVLIAAVGRLAAPETVREEVLRKARIESRFRPAERIWHRLEPRWIEVLSDDETPQLAAVVQRVSQVPMAERLLSRADLGEVMVIAHAVVSAEAGNAVTILIDDQDGARLATQEGRRLDRLRGQGVPVGSLTIANTETVLARAAGSTHLPDRSSMRSVYDRMRGLDDGLVHIDQTSLLSPEVWTT